MKKYLFVLFATSLFAVPAQAYLTTDQAVSEEYIINHGHSQEMARLIDLQADQINDTPRKYKSKDPDWYNQPRVKFVRKIFMYMDPGLDNGKFMQGDIKFSPSCEDI